MRSWAARDCDSVAGFHPAAAAALVSTVFWIAVTLASPTSAARTEKVADAINATRATSALVHTSPLVTRGDTFIVPPVREPRRPCTRMASCRELSGVSLAEFE